MKTRIIFAVFACIQFFIITVLLAMIYFSGLGPWGPKHDNFGKLLYALENGIISQHSAPGDIFSLAKPDGDHQIKNFNTTSTSVFTFRRHREVIIIFVRDDSIFSALYIETGGGGQVKYFFDEHHF